MKKVYAILLCLLLVASVAVTAFAATPVEMTVEPAKTSVTRGETVELSVKVSNVEKMTSGMALLLYDESVFDFVDGQCTAELPKPPKSVGVSKDDAGMVSAVMLPAEATDVSGEIFKIQLKIKDTAAFGKVTIQVNPAIRAADASGNPKPLEATAENVELEIVCSHSWSAWTKADDANCSRTCSICEEVETAAHKFGAFEETKAPTCSQPGEKTATCSVCNATKTEAIDPTGKHTYGAPVKVDDAEHKLVCDCGAEKTEAHAFGAFEVTKEPTCKDEGEQVAKCACGAEKVEAIPVTEDHAWGEWVNVDEKEHKHTCPDCGKEESAEHVFDDKLIAGETTHWFACECGAKKDEAAHVENAEKWYSDENNHWHACDCGVAGTVAPHTWDEGKVTKAPTTKKEGIKTYTCTECGAEKTESIPKLESPATGDEMMILPMVLLMVLSTVGVAVAVIGKKRASK